MVDDLKNIPASSRKSGNLIKNMASFVQATKKYSGDKQMARAMNKRN